MGIHRQHRQDRVCSHGGTNRREIRTENLIGQDREAACEPIRIPNGTTGSGFSGNQGSFPKHDQPNARRTVSEVAPAQKRLTA